MTPSLAAELEGGFSESPCWIDGELVWADVRDGLVCRARPGGPTRTQPLNCEVGAVVAAAGGRLAVCRTGGVDLLDVRTGELTRLAAIEPDGSDNRMNDAATDRRGRLWCGTRSRDGRARSGSLYRVDPDGSVTRALDGIAISNGIAWSPDDGLMYHVDSPTGRIDAYAFDAAAGTLGVRTTFASFPPGLLPDGLCVDELGGVWVALWGSSEVRRLAPDGALDVVVEVGAVHATSCCFGGADLDVLFVTTAQDDGSSGRAGSVFAAETGVRGLAVAPFAA
jgi:sugar lactone lactonase YvrE